MLSEQIETFRQSSRTFTASEIVDTYEDIKLRLLNAWIASPSSDGEGREELYRQLRGLESILDQLVAGWGKQ